MKRAPEPWNDLIFVRRYDGVTETWIASNAVEDGHREFASRAEAEAFVQNQLPERASVERWARVIDKKFWEDFDIDPTVRNGFISDYIFESLKNAKRIRDTLLADTGDTSATDPPTSEES